MKLVNITGRVLNPDLTPVPHAIGKAVLTSYEVDGGVIVPSIVDIVADANGDFVVSLWPNGRGSGGSQYIVKLYDGFVTVFEARIVVPDVSVDVDISNIIIAPPYPPVNESLRALLDVQAASVIVKAAEVAVIAAEASAKASKIAAKQSEDAAKLSEQNAEEYKQTAANKAQDSRISDSVKAVTLTPELRGDIEKISPHVNLIRVKVAEKIALQYSVTDEIKLLRTAPSEEFDIYNDYAESCRAWGREERAKLGL